MSLNWEPLLKLLKVLSSDLGLTPHFLLDPKYLQQAFKSTESLWLQQFDRMSDVKVSGGYVDLFLWVSPLHQ